MKKEALIIKNEMGDIVTPEDMTMEDITKIVAECVLVNHPILTDDEALNVRQTTGEAGNIPTTSTVSYTTGDNTHEKFLLVDDDFMMQVCSTTLTSKSCESDPNKILLIDPKEKEFYEVDKQNELIWFIREDQDILNADNYAVTIKQTNTILDDEDDPNSGGTTIIKETIYKGDEVSENEDVITFPHKKPLKKNSWEKIKTAIIIQIINIKSKYTPNTKER